MDKEKYYKITSYGIKRDLTVEQRVRLYRKVLRVIKHIFIRSKDEQIKSRRASEDNKKSTRK